LHPPCPSQQRIFLWRGINSPPPAVLDIPIIRHAWSLALRSSLNEATNYGAGLRKFHVFCDTFSIPEYDCLPAAFPLLHSFAIWAVTDPDPEDAMFADGTVFETVSIPTVRKYLAAIRAWHLAQGWPPPLSETEREHLEFSLRGMACRQGVSRKPPITLPMMRALQSALSLNNSFDACIWATATAAFFGLMRFGEVSVPSHTAYHADRYLSRNACLVTTDADGHPYAWLRLPHAKTSMIGDVQDVFLVEQVGLCPLCALHNLALFSPAAGTDPLFSWRDRIGTIRPMLKTAALSRINTILSEAGWGTAFGHSFRIGGVSFYLAQGVSAEIVRLHGRWRSLAYEVYIHAFEQIASRHL
ncbi:hypothetical protein BDQ17DRAFT_1180883, partial [Cyathus striatus]